MDQGYAYFCQSYWTKLYDKLGPVHNFVNLIISVDLSIL